MDDYTWVRNVAAVNLDELSNLYRIAPLGDKPPPRWRRDAGYAAWLPIS